MSTYQTIIRRRSIRRFKQKPIALSLLKKVVDAARLAPSAANLQPIEFIIVNNKILVEKIFQFTAWAGYLGDKGAPEEGRRPTAYIAALVNSKKCKKPKYSEADVSAAIENILLVATELGLGSCWLGAINREKIAKILSVPKYVSLAYLVALGYPDEKSVAEEMTRSH
ncbi:MAG: nitroreductase, partial [Candidatus Omnitrophica bacterium]|nr:nitroreductase [Candidatus Omnitrophota bacterium]